MNITLRCPLCKRTLSVERLPNDPPQAAIVEVLCCGQWSESAHYFDVAGRELYGDPESKDFGKPLSDGING